MLTNSIPIKILIVNLIFLSFLSCKSVKEMVKRDNQHTIEGRPIIYRSPDMVLNISKFKDVSGVVKLDVCIAPTGLISSLAIREKETTIKSETHIMQIMRALGQYKYAPAPEIKGDQCGQYTIYIEKQPKQ